MSLEFIYDVFICSFGLASEWILIKLLILGALFKAMSMMLINNVLVIELKTSHKIGSV